MSNTANASIPVTTTKLASASDSASVFVSASDSNPASYPDRYLLPRGQYLWSPIENRYIFMTGAYGRIGIHPTIVGNGNWNGKRGIWIRPNRGEIARRSMPREDYMLRFWNLYVHANGATAWVETFVHKARIYEVDAAATDALWASTEEEEEEEKEEGAKRRPPEPKDTMPTDVEQQTTQTQPNNDPAYGPQPEPNIPYPRGLSLGYRIDPRKVTIFSLEKDDKWSGREFVGDKGSTKMRDPSRWRAEVIADGRTFAMSCIGQRSIWSTDQDVRAAVELKEA